MSIVPNVRRLHLDSVEEVSDDLLVETLSRRTSLMDLEVVSFVRCGSITEASLEVMGDTLQFLGFVDVSHCSAVSRGDVDRFLAKRKQQHRPVEVKWS